MKKQLFVLLGLGLLLGTSAYAQTVNLKADIPFNFIVTGATLPAGEYTIKGLSNGETMAISNSNRKAATLVMSNRCQSMQSATKSKLVFHRYGDRYFLANIWVEGDTSGRQLRTSPREREVARDYSVENVTLYAALR